MEKLEKELRNKLSGAKKIAILSIGSQLKGDDAGGILAAESLRQSLAPAEGWSLPVRQAGASGANRPAKTEIGIFIGGTAPENITSEIKKFGPSHLIIIDAADMNGEPGEIKLIDPENIGGISFSTHNLPANMLIEYLRQFLKCEVIIIGIQPKSIEFGKEPSAEIKKSAKSLSLLLQNIFK